MSKPIELPRQFTNVKLDGLWEYLKICNEMIELSVDVENRKYWEGWHDCMCTLLGDLTGRPTTAARHDKVLAYCFDDFRMEDKLLAAEDEINDENGL